MFTFEMKKGKLQFITFILFYWFFDNCFAFNNIEINKQDHRKSTEILDKLKYGRILQNCSTNKSCTSCQNDEYLLEGECISKVNLPDGLYCDQIGKKCNLCKEISCKSCDSSLMKCEECPKKYYTFKNICFPVPQQGTYCDQQTFQCQECKEDSCDICDSSLKYCIACKDGQFLLNGVCSNIQPKNTFCTKVLNYITNFSYMQCEECFQNCEQCFGSQQNECTQCKDSYVLRDNQCISNFTEYDSSISTDKANSIAQWIFVFSCIYLVISTIIGILESILFRNSQLILISNINTFKIPFLVLTSSDFPYTVYSFLRKTASTNPIFYLQVINPMNIFLEDSINGYVNTKFQSIDLQYSILKNCGQVLSIAIICAFIFLIFYLLTKNKENCENITILKIYEKGFSSLAIQSSQLLIPILFTGIIIQCLEFDEKQLSNPGGQKEVKIIMTFIFIIILLFLLFAFYKVINLPLVDQFFNYLTLLNITQQKIINGCISESKVRKNFMLIYIGFNSFIIPIILISGYKTSTLKVSLLVLVQIFFFIFVILIRPFIQKQMNVFYLIDSFSWIVYYVEFFALTLLVQSKDASINKSSMDSISWIIILHTFFIYSFYPIYSLVQIAHRLLNKQQYQQQEGIEKQYSFDQTTNQQQLLFKKPTIMQLSRLNHSLVLKTKAVNIEQL